MDAGDSAGLGGRPCSIQFAVKILQAQIEANLLLAFYLNDSAFVDRDFHRTKTKAAKSLKHLLGVLFSAWG